MIDPFGVVFKGAHDVEWNVERYWVILRSHTFYEHHLFTSELEVTI